MNMIIFNTFPIKGVKTVPRTLPDCIAVTTWQHLMTDSSISGVHL